MKKDPKKKEKKENWFQELFHDAWYTAVLEVVVHAIWNTIVGIFRLILWLPRLILGFLKEWN
ncbi:hypothetical protein Q75_16375 [Bacillus coahuilensis p1.1.43]|uniref:Uncharacterized protein n=1 Tax=Bacillus coahuilensis p1.1.43 TaxID=1150625 RepID=A0A147K4A8_9BACI|nr:hypothetical protein [Bacillus coahuilensis]KUP04161.1 hypothetical protein Q75_16375 [Bacillus coahuilensis p1.1.43]